MPRIFISYRRADSAHFTGRIHDRLVDVFGDRSVFRDVYDIPAGSDFRAVLEQETGRCDFLLVIIGPQWVGITNDKGKRRLDDPDDFARIEVEAGLKRPGTRVIPVLVEGAAMPRPEELPESLRDLCFRNAVTVRDDPDFPTDMERLLRQLRPGGVAGLLRKGWPFLALLAALAVAAVFLLPRLIGPGPDGLATDTPEPVAEGTPTGYYLEPGETYLAAYGFSLYADPSADSMIVARSAQGEDVTIVEQNGDRSWTRVRLAAGDEGWVLTEDVVLGLALPTMTPTSVATPIAVEQGFGMRTDAWAVYFTAPELIADPQTEYGINIRLADALGRARTSVDVALFELSDPLLVQTLVEAHQHGVRVRIVADDEYGPEAEDSLFPQLQEAGIPVVTDERSSLMHDKFFIIDGTSVWTGSWNLSEGSTFDQNNNVLVFDSPDLAALYAAEFEEMFSRGEFGPGSTVGGTSQVTVEGIPVEVYFAPEDAAGPRLLELIGGAEHSIRVMAFSFTNPDIGAAMVEQVQAGVTVTGILEGTGSAGPYSQLAPLSCAGANMRLDGNPSFMHHKVIVIDDAIVITGSLNFTSNALETNDENVLIVFDPALAAAYTQEFERLWAVANAPTDIVCP
jgi:HKD family nuclease